MWSKSYNASRYLSKYELITTAGVQREEKKGKKVQKREKKENWCPTNSALFWICRRGGGGRGGIAGSDLRSTSSASRQLFRNVPEFEQAIILIVQCFMFNNITRAEFLILADKWSFSLNHQDGNIDFEILFPFSSVSDRSILM